MNVTITGSLTDAQRAAWDAFWRESSHAHPRQHPALGDVERARGRVPLFAAAERDGKIVAAAVMTLDPIGPGARFAGEAVCLRGPAFDDVETGREFVGELVRRMSALSAGRVRLSPYWYYPEAEVVEAMLRSLGFSPCGESPRQGTGLVDLTRKEEEILASFSKSTRREIRLADKRGVDVRPLDAGQELESAYKCLDALRRQRGLPLIRPAEFAEVFARVYRDQDLGVLIGAVKDGRVLGAIMCSRSAKTAHVEFYAVDADAGRELSNLSIGPVLWWRVFQWAKARGCTAADVEGNVTPLDPSHPMFELENFKRRFDPQAVERLDEHAIVCHPAVWFGHRQVARIGRLRRRAAARIHRAFEHRRGSTRARPLAAEPPPAPANEPAEPPSAA